MTEYQQMDLFSKTPPSRPYDDERMVKMERGTAYLSDNRDFPDDYTLFFELEIIAYETDLETGNEVIASEYKTIYFMTWSELQKLALKMTEKWSRSYDHISVSVQLRPMNVLEYFGD